MNTMNRTKRMIRSSVVYTLGNVLSKAMVFFLLPVYTKYLSAEEYGIYDIEISNVTVLSTFLFFESASMILRFLLTAKSKENQCDVLTNSFALFCYSTVAYFAIMLCSSALFRFPYSAFLIAYGFLYVFLPTIGYTARGFGYSKAYAIVGVVDAAITATCSIILIVFLGWKVEALFLSGIIGHLFAIGILQYKLRIHRYIRKACFSWRKQQEMIAFAFPLALTTLTFWLFSAFNKNIIASRLSIADNGYYAIATKFSTIFMIVMSGLSAAWQEMAFSEEGAKEEKAAFFSEALKKFMVLLGIVTFIFLAGTKVVFPLMVDQDFLHAESLIPLSTVAVVINLFSGYLSSIAGNIKHTEICTYSALLGAGVNVICMFILVDGLGMQAANVSLCVGYGTMLLCRWYDLTKYLPLRVHWPTLCILLIGLTVSCILFIYGNWQISILELVIGIAIMLVYFRDKLICIVNHINIPKWRQ